MFFGIQDIILKAFYDCKIGLNPGQFGLVEICAGCQLKDSPPKIGK